MFVRLLTMKSSQSTLETFCSYRKMACWSVYPTHLEAVVFSKYNPAKFLKRAISYFNFTQKDKLEPLVLSKRFY